MQSKQRRELFDRWANEYDHRVREEADQDAFPFAGYDRVLGMVWEKADVDLGMTVLDIGTGTGNLAALFTASGCRVWGIDFSSEMLEQARSKVPDAHFLQADLNAGWPDTLPGHFNRIVSAYVLHEFTLPHKLRIVKEMISHLSPGGWAVVGDVSFPTAKAREASRQVWADRWDSDESYWAADETIEACHAAGLAADYVQVSSCGGVYVIQQATSG
jgi:putative AdoMet-dependent methyltransferase